MVAEEISTAILKGGQDIFSISVYFTIAINLCTSMLHSSEHCQVSRSVLNQSPEPYSEAYMRSGCMLG